MGTAMPLHSMTRNARHRFQSPVASRRQSIHRMATWVFPKGEHGLDSREMLLRRHSRVAHARTQTLEFSLKRPAGLDWEFGCNAMVGQRGNSKIRLCLGYDNARIPKGGPSGGPTDRFGGRFSCGTGECFQPRVPPTIVNSSLRAGYFGQWKLCRANFPCKTKLEWSRLRRMPVISVATTGTDLKGESHGRAACRTCGKNH